MRTLDLVASFMASRRLKGLSKRSLESYSYQLGKFADNILIIPKQKSSIIQDIESYLSTIEGPHNRHQAFRYIRAFFNWVERQYQIDNPMQYVTRPRVPKKVMPTLEKVDIFLLMSLVEDNPRDKALIYLFLDTGIRASEATNLRKTDIKDGYIVVDGKVGERLVPISNTTKDLLLLISSPFKDSGDVGVHPRKFIFYGRNGKTTRSGARDIVEYYLIKIGYQGEKKGPQMLRHTFARHYLMNGGDLRSLQLILGHSNIKTTEKYASLVMADVKEKHNKFSPINLVSVAEP